MRSLLKPLIAGGAVLAAAWTVCAADAARPFCPIGSYELPRTDEKLHAVRGSGFNLFVCHNKADLDRAAAAGGMRWAPLPMQLGRNQKLRDTTAAVKDHPALAVWEGPYDRVWNLSQKEQQVRGPIQGNFRRPVRVADSTDQYRSTGRHRPVWMVLQVFDYSSSRETGLMAYVALTRAEARPRPGDRGVSWTAGRVVCDWVIDVVNEDDEPRLEVEIVGLPEMKGRRLDLFSGTKTTGLSECGFVTRLLPREVEVFATSRRWECGNQKGIDYARAMSQEPATAPAQERKGS